MAKVTKLTAEKLDKDSTTPYYMGSTDRSKAQKAADSANSQKKIAHYVMIKPSVAARLGIKSKKGTVKTNDVIAANAIFRPAASYKNKSVTFKSRRDLQEGSVPVTLYTGNKVPKTRSGKVIGKTLVPEEFTVGFPASMTITQILGAVNHYMPLVKFVRHRSSVYVPKKNDPKKSELTTDTAKSV